MAALGLQNGAGTREAGGPQAALIPAFAPRSARWSRRRTTTVVGAGPVAAAPATLRLVGVVWALSLAELRLSSSADTIGKATLRCAAGHCDAERRLRTSGGALHGLSRPAKATLRSPIACTAAGRACRAALAYLALTLANLDRKSMAADLLPLLAQKMTNGRKLSEGCLPWNESDTELKALACLAEQRVNPLAPRIKPLVDDLLARRVGYRWMPEKATGPAVLALSDWFARTRYAGEKYTLTVFVNEAQAAVLEFDETAGTRLVAIPKELLAKAGRQRIQFRLTGRGRYTYQCTLGGFVPADKLKSTTTDWWVHRTIEPAPLEVDGKEVPRGHDIISGSYSWTPNKVTQLPVGQRAIVHVGIHLDWPRIREQRWPYLVVTEPLPTGVTVLEKSITGQFERFEIGPGAITFYMQPTQNPNITYTISGYVPGQYRAGPTVVRDAYRPELVGVARAANNPRAVTQSIQLTVLPAGQKSADEYRLSPRELFELGKIEFAKKRWPEAGGYLTRLMTEHNLHADPYKESARMLLDIHLETGPAAAIVKYFEIIKEKYPDLEIPFAKIVKVGAAYHDLGEYERSFLVFRATLESNFFKESEAAGFLEARGEFLRSVAVMQRLVQEYPPEPYVAGAAYALAQQVYAKAPIAVADAKLREHKVGRADLIRRAITMLDDFLSEYPDDPAADQASFAVANALLDLKAYTQAIERCTKFAQRYPKSDFLDSYWYVIGYSHFAQGKAEEAMAMCRKVAEAKRLDRSTGREVESPNKWQAVYILGQVYHSLGQAADAIKEYTRVAERYIDAKQAIEYFMRKEIALPEVTTVKPGAQATVELKYRNVPTCDVKAYRIDLMKFGLLRATSQHHRNQSCGHPSLLRPASRATARITVTAAPPPAAQRCGHLPRRLSRRRPLRHRPRLGHTLRRRNPGGSRIWPRPRHGQRCDQRPIRPRGPGESHRHAKPRLRLRGHRPAWRLRRRRHHRPRHRPRPRRRRLCLLPRQVPPWRRCGRNDIAKEGGAAGDNAAAAGTAGRGPTQESQ